MLIKNNHTAIIHLPHVKADGDYPGPSSFSLQPGVTEVPREYMDRLGDHPYVRDMFRAHKGHAPYLVVVQPEEQTIDAEPTSDSEGESAPAAPVSVAATAAPLPPLPAPVKS